MKTTNTHLPSDCLLALDADQFTSLLKTIRDEPLAASCQRLESFDMESARRAAWCEVNTAAIQVEAGNSTPAEMREDLKKRLVEVNAQRRLSDLLEILRPLILRRNKTAAQADEDREYAEYLADQSAPDRERFHALKARDVRIVNGEEPNLLAIVDEIELTKRILNEGQWKNVSRDYQENAFAQELSELHRQGKYRGEIGREAAEQRITELQAGYENLSERVENSLSLSEINELAQLESKLASADEELRKAADKASASLMEESAAAGELASKLDAVEIIGLGIIRAYGIQSGRTGAGIEHHHPAA